MSNKLPESMQVCMLRGKESMEVVEVSFPDLPPGGLILQTKSVGICGSDIIKVMNSLSTERRVIGHEIAGEVVQIDPRADHIYQIGDRIAVGHVHVPCLHCQYCRRGSFAMCASFKRSRVTPGGFSEYVALSADHVNHTVMRIPDAMHFDQATFIDPIACCLHAINRLHWQPLDHAVVVGIGVMGLLFVQLLHQLQVEVIAVDISDLRLEKATALGADLILNPLRHDAWKEIKSNTGRCGADFVVLTVTNQATIDQSMTWIRDGGAISIFAGPVEQSPLKLDFYELFRRELNLVSSYSASLSEMGQALAWVETGKIQINDMITGYCELEGILTAIQSMNEESYKIIVHP